VRGGPSRLGEQLLQIRAHAAEHRIGSGIDVDRPRPLGEHPPGQRGDRQSAVRGPEVAAGDDDSGV